MMKPNKDGLEILADMVHNNCLKPAIWQSFSLDEAPAAHRLSESGHARGKIVIIVDEATHTLREGL